MDGWDLQGKPHSFTSLEWFTYLNRKPDVNVQHTGNRGEHVIHGDKTLFVDDYEFHAFSWLGCPKCYPDRDRARHKMCNQTMRDVHEATIAKEDLLFKLGYDVIIMWQCEWEQLKKDDKAYTNLSSPLNSCRDSSLEASHNLKMSRMKFQSTTHRTKSNRTRKPNH